MIMEYPPYLNQFINNMKDLKIISLALFLVASLYLLYPEQSSRQCKLYEQWKNNFGMTFTPQEDIYRKIIFMKNCAEIEKHNADITQTYTIGINQFSHLTKEEFASSFLTKYYIKDQSVKLDEKFLKMGNVEIDVDWESAGKVTAVKNQGQCDAGYAFCSAGLTESFYLFGNKNVSLSEQQIIDCSGDYTTFGCQGGSRNGTLLYIKTVGLNPTSAYPYRGVKNNCQKPTGEYKPVYTQKEYSGCPAIQAALLNGPVTVAVNAVDWLNYKAGIFNNCKSVEVNHDIFLIGVTSTYWRLKNSWGLTWGEYGYIRLQLGNMCGICEKPAFGFK